MKAWFKEILFPSTLVLANGKSVTPKRSSMVYIVPVLLVLVLDLDGSDEFQFIGFYLRAVINSLSS